MNAILKAILKPILLVLLPIVFEELKKLLENWKSEQPAQKFSSSSGPGDFSAFLDSPETAAALMNAVGARDQLVSDLQKLAYQVSRDMEY